jgi:hypothetical protein
VITCKYGTRAGKIKQTPGLSSVNERLIAEIGRQAPLVAVTGTLKGLLKKDRKVFKAAACSCCLAGAG